MKQITVTYLLSDEELERLERIVEAYKEQKGLDSTPCRLFEGIMLCGAKYDIDKKFSTHEEILSLQNELKSL